MVPELSLADCQQWLVPRIQLLRELPPLLTIDFGSFALLEQQWLENHLLQEDPKDLQGDLPVGHLEEQLQ